MARGKEQIVLLRAKLIGNRRQLKWFEDDQQINKRIRECDRALAVLDKWKSEECLAV
jgi:hypothetical protein